MLFAQTVKFREYRERMRIFVYEYSVKNVYYPTFSNKFQKEHISSVNVYIFKVSNNKL